MLVRFAGAGVLHGGLRPSSCLGGLTNFLRLFNSGEALCAYHGERGKDRGPVDEHRTVFSLSRHGLIYGPGTLLLLPSQLQTWPISLFAHSPGPLPTSPVEARCHFFHITLCEVCLFLPPTPTVSGRGYRLLLGFRVQAGEYVSPFSLGRTTPRRRVCLKPQHGVAI